MPTDEEIARHHEDGRPDSDAWVEGKRAACREMNARPGGVTGIDHNRHHAPVGRDNYDRMSRAHGMLR